MSTPSSAETWRHVDSISKVEADRLLGSRAELARYLSDRFKKAFGVDVEDATVESFPNGVSVTLEADVPPHAKYNVWGHSISRAFADAGATAPVNVLVRGSNELRGA